MLGDMATQAAQVYIGDSGLLSTLRQKFVFSSHLYSFVTLWHSSILPPSGLTF